jgi:general stress protein YciG
MPRNDEHKGTSNRGFASMDQAKQREIASKGGQSVPPEKRSFSQDPALAAQAGRKGGESVPPEGRSFSQNRELAAEAGRKGGQARGASSQRARAAAQNFKENRDNAAEGARKTSPPKDQIDQDERSRQGRSPQDFDHTEDFEERNEARSGSHDIQQDDLGKSAPVTDHTRGKEHPFR